MKRTKFLEFLKNNAAEAGSRYYPLIALLLIASIFLTFLLYNGVEFIKSKYKPGEIAKKTIIAKKSFRYINVKATNKLLKQKIENVPDVYLFYPDTKIMLLGKIKEAFVSARSYKMSHKKDSSNLNISEDIFSSKLGIKLNKPVLNAFYFLNYDRHTENHILKIINAIYKRGVLSMPPSSNKKIELRNVITNSSKIIGYPQVFFTFKGAGEFAHYYVKHYLGFLRPYVRNDIYNLVYHVIKPDIIYSKYLTLKKIEDIKKKVPLIYVNVGKGMLLVNSGDLITKDKALELNTYESIFKLSNNIPSLFGLFFIIAILLSLSYIFPYKYIKKFRLSLDFKNILFIITILITSILVIKAGIIFANALTLYFPFVNSSDIYYLIPFAFGPMLIRIVLNSEVSVVYIALFSILTSIIFKNSIFFMIYTFAGSFIASYEVFDFSSWGKIVRAGVITGILNMFMVVAFALLRLNLINIHNIYSIVFAFLSGIIASIAVIGLIPLLERIFGYTTDFKLLELSNTNHPLLKRLSIIAPGTYQHSIMVATLAESAASSIGANPLLARVASLYHDIGKIIKPNYYIENISNQENPHDKLAPTMSSLIIASHVKDGQELARKYKLGTRVEYIIGEHHGTSMIGVFYEKASKEGKSENISKDTFRYNSKKPQTKEAGIIMLADSVEAISRTIVNISPSRLELMVRKTVTRIYNDGQLDECELTLKDLHIIGDAFVKVLNSIFHQRIPYTERTSSDEFNESDEDKGNNKHNKPAAEAEGRPKVSPL